MQIFMALKISFPSRVLKSEYMSEHATGLKGWSTVTAFNFVLFFFYYYYLKRPLGRS